MDVLAAKKKAKGKKDEKNQESEETVVDENDKIKTDTKDEPNETIADNDRDAKASKEETETPPKNDDDIAVAKEEKDLFERIQGAGIIKTREEAERDRQKLLAGELLVEGGAESEDDDDDLNNDTENDEDTKVAKSETKVTVKKITAAEHAAQVLREAGYADGSRRNEQKNLSSPKVFEKSLCRPLWWNGGGGGSYGV